MRRTRYRAAAEVTRRIRGPLQVALLAEYEHARFTSLPGPSVFATDFPSGELKQDDVTGRLALIYDTRDNEYNTHQGLLLEAGDPGRERRRRLHPPVRDPSRVPAGA